MDMQMPDGACNAHCHVFGPRGRFPYAPNAAFIPAEDAPREALYALNDGFGLSRCVVVQSTCHGFDNAATEHALAGRPGAYRGIALLRPDTDAAELRRLDAAGFRGVRFNFMGHLGAAAPIADIIALAGRIAGLGWHLQIHGDPQLLIDFGPALLAGPVPVVIDHIGRVDAGLGAEGVHFQALLRLMERGAWVKVSGIDRITRGGPPYDDAVPLARALVEGFPDRVVWGNDWPHPNHQGPMPVEADLVAAIARIAPTPALRRGLMADNPARLYRFAGAA